MEFYGIDFILRFNNPLLKQTMQIQIWVRDEFDRFLDF